MNTHVGYIHSSHQECQPIQFGQSKIQPQCIDVATERVTEIGRNRTAEKQSFQLHQINNEVEKMDSTTCGSLNIKKGNIWQTDGRHQTHGRNNFTSQYRLEDKSFRPPHTTFKGPFKCYIMRRGWGHCRVYRSDLLSNVISVTRGCESHIFQKKHYYNIVHREDFTS